MLDHQHLIVRAEISNPPTDTSSVKLWLEELIIGIGMNLAIGLEANPIAYYCTQLGNRGLTAAAILETSHSVVHFWDDINPGIMQFDLYSCSCVDIDQIFNFLTIFKPIKIEYKFLDRDSSLTVISSGVI